MKKYKKSDGDRPRSLGGDRPRSFGGDRPRSLGGDRPRNSGGDRPRSFGGDRPRSFSGDRPCGPGGESSESDYIEPLITEGRNPVNECLKNNAPVDMLYVLDGCHDGPVETAKRLAAKAGIRVKYLSGQEMDRLSPTGRHQGLIAKLSAREYAAVEDILKAAGERGERPFILLADGIEDPHNLGAIIRTAYQVGAHGLIIRENRAVGLSATVARTSAGAIEYLPVARVTNLVSCIEDLKKEGLWFVCSAANGEPMYKVDMKGPIGLVIGSEGKGVSRLVREHCDLVAAIPMKGKIDSLNASVAAGILCYEALRQREFS